jgi:hypothetical protein
MLLHFTVYKPGSARSHLLILPVRDTLTFALWGWSFVTRTVRWRDGHFRVTRNGAFQPVMRRAPAHPYGRFERSAEGADSLLGHRSNR